MKNKKLIYLGISVLFILLTSLNVLSDMNFPHRGDHYYSTISTEGIIKYFPQPLGDFDIFHHKSNVTLNHPPFYNYVLALILFIFKKNVILNFTGIILNLLSAFFMLKIAKLAWKDISEKTKIIIFCLFLLIPLVVQQSTLVDLDAILLFSICLFVYFYLKYPNNLFLSSVLFSLIWLIKFQGIPVIVMSLFFYLILTKKSKKDYINFIFTILIGSFLSLGIIYLYSFLIGINPEKMFAHSSIIDIIIKQVLNLKRTFLITSATIKLITFWILPGVWVLYLLGIFTYIKEKLWNKYPLMIFPLLISIFTLLELLPIGSYGWNFPRYYIDFLPFMILAMIPVLEKIKFNKKDLLIGIIGFFIILNYFLIIPDPYIPEANEAFTPKNYAPLIAKVISNLNLLLFPYFLFFIFYIKNKITLKEVSKILLIASIVLALSINIIQLTKPYSTNNLYGDSHEDLKNTLEYLRENTSPQDKLLLFAHVGYYFGNENNTNWYNSMLCYNSEACMTNITVNQEIKFMQFYPKDLKRLNGKLKDIVGVEFEPDKTFGDYIIYKRK